MGLTKDEFFDLACRWGYDHQTKLIADDEFLPIAKDHGTSDCDIERFKNALGSTGQIKNLRGIGGMRDFEISPAHFRQYLRGVLPASTLPKAQALYDSWKRLPKGAFQMSTLVESLGISEIEATYLLEVVRD